MRRSPPSAAARNADLCRDLGADEVVDHRTTDPWKDRWTARGTFDAIFDVFGNGTFDRARSLLASPGTYVHTIPSARIALDAARTALRARTAKLVLVRCRRPDLEELARLVEAGALRSVIDSTYPLEDVKEAHRRIETRRARGKIVLRVKGGPRGPTPRPRAGGRASR